MAAVTVEHARGKTSEALSLKDLVSQAAFVVVTQVEAAISWAKAYRSRRNTIAQLSALSDDMLKDIGVNRADIDEVVGGR